MLLNRDPYPFDFELIATEAARRKVYLEINSSPERLDLTASHIRAAKAQGMQVRHQYRCASPQASGQHAIRGHAWPAAAGSRRRTF